MITDERTQVPSQPQWPCLPLGTHIECAPAVLSAVCLEAVTALRKLKGGLEGGGVLWGNRIGGVIQGVIQIVASRPIQCEHKFGPSFVLSENDEAGLRDMLADSRTDPDLASLEPLGLYLSHSRHGVDLTDRELELCAGFFAGTCRIALVLIPNLLGTVRVTLLAPDAEGTHVSCHEVPYSVLTQPQLDVVRRKSHRSNLTENRALPENRARAAAAGSSVVIPVEPPAPGYPAQSAAVETPKLVPISAPTSLPAPPQSSGVTRKGFLAAGLLLALCWQNPKVPAAQIPLSLTERDRNLIIQWDPNRLVRNAAQGTIDIRDGESAPVRVAVSPEILRRGWLPYSPQSDLVRISFTVTGQGMSASENAIYFAPKRNRGVSPEAKPAAIVDATAKANPVPTPATASQVDTKAAPGNVEQKAPPRSFRAPVEQLARTNSLPGAVSADGPAILADAPALKSESPLTGPLVHPVLALSLPAPRTEAPKPASGRLIWTGQLPKRAILSFSAQGASSGYVDGWLPKAPVQVDVRPAELIDGGMVIYTKEQTAHTELPDPKNGWNTVLYKWDPPRAAELEVLESPGPANNWNQLVLRNSDRRLAIIVLDWRTLK